MCMVVVLLNGIVRISQTFPELSNIILCQVSIVGINACVWKVPSQDKWDCIKQLSAVA